MPDDKSMQNLKITIDKSIVHDETDNELKTRVPGTYGENIRYLFLHKSDVEEINNGKTFLYSLKANSEYMLYDKNDNFIEKMQGIDLYNSHYDPSVYKKNTEKQKNNDSVDFESNLQSSKEKSASKTSPDDISDRLNNILAENTKNENADISVSVIANIAEHYEKKISSLEDNNLKLSEKIDKTQIELNKAQKFINTCNEFTDPNVAKALPAPMVNLVKLISDEKQSKVQSLQSKINKYQNKITVNQEKIDKQKDKITIVEKINKFLTNMKSPEGRKENFVFGLKEFQSMSLNNTQNKLEAVNAQINKTINDYQSTRYTSEKFKLQEKLVKLNNRRENLVNKIESLNSLNNKLSAFKKITDYKAEDIISKSYDGVVNAAINNPEAFIDEPVDAVVNVCKDVLNKEILSKRQRLENNIATMKIEADKYYDFYGHDNWNLLRDIDKAQAELAELESSDKKISKRTTVNSQKESENYLKNAEMSIEDDYDSIDGIINNGSKQQEQEKFTKSQNSDKKNGKSFSPLSRKQIKESAKEIATAEHSNEVNKSKSKGQEL